MIINCRKCGKDAPFEMKVGFRDICPHCSAYLHSCSHCRFLDEGTSRCTEPMAEKVRDLEAGNFCDLFFSVSTDGGIGGSATDGGDRNDAEDLWKKLTGKS